MKGKSIDEVNVYARAHKISYGQAVAKMEYTPPKRENPLCYNCKRPIADDRIIFGYCSICNEASSSEIWKPRNCAKCGIGFKPKAANQKYCSVSCAKEMHRLQKELFNDRTRGRKKPK